MIPIPWIATLQRAALIVRQTVRGWNRTRIMQRRARRRIGYAEWVRKYDTLNDESRRLLQSRMQSLQDAPRFTVILRVSMPEMNLAAAAVDAIRRQIFPTWRLILWPEPAGSATLINGLDALAGADERILVFSPDAPVGARTDVLSGEPTDAPYPSGSVAEHFREWLVLTRARSVLAEHALLRLAEAVCAGPACMIYADEDQLGAQGQRTRPYFKPQWNVDLACAQDLTGDLLALDTGWLRAEGLLPGTGGRDLDGRPGPVQVLPHAHDLALRCAERCEPQRILRLPLVLAHRQAMPPEQALALTQATDEASLHAVSTHLHRTGRWAEVEHRAPGRFRVRWALPDPAPKVSILIPTRNQLGLLRQCIETLDALTNYPNREVIVIDNGSDEPAALAYLESLRQRPRHRVIRDDRPFNFSALNNLAARQAEGELLLLLNNDIEVIEPGWLTEMVSLACRPEVGAVGAKLLYPDRTVQHAGFILGWGPHGALEGGHVFKGLPVDEGGHGDRAVLTQSWLAVTGACLMVRKALFEAVGGLNEQDLSVAFNDIDLCLRLGSQGYTNLCTPHALLIHHESISRGRDGSGRGPKAERYRRELAWVVQRWSATLSHDPYAHPNLTLGQEDFACADPPRAPPLEGSALTTPVQKTALPPTPVAR